MTTKEGFAAKLVQLVNELKRHVSTEDGQWTVKGFIDIFKTFPSSNRMMTPSNLPLISRPPTEIQKSPIFAMGLPSVHMANILKIARVKRISSSHTVLIPAISALGLSTTGRRGRQLMKPGYAGWMS